MREAWRIQKMQLGESLTVIGVQLHVFIIYSGKDLPVYSDVYNKMGTLLKKMEKLIQS